MSHFIYFEERVIWNQRDIRLKRQTEINDNATLLCKKFVTRAISLKAQQEHMRGRKSIAKFTIMKMRILMESKIELTEFGFNDFLGLIKPEFGK